MTSPLFTAMKLTYVLAALPDSRDATAPLLVLEISITFTVQPRTRPKDLRDTENERHMKKTEEERVLKVGKRIPSNSPTLLCGSYCVVQKLYQL